MKRTTVAMMVVLFAASMMVGALVSPQVEAKPPIPCTYKCINQDTYFCCLVAFNPVTEVCTFQEILCDGSSSCHYECISDSTFLICSYYGGRVDTTFHYAGC